MNAENERLINLLKAHSSWRGNCINLVAAENRMSPLARRLLSSDLSQRYGDYVGRDIFARKYFGTRFVAEIEEEVSRIAQQIFKAKFIELRSISGHVAGNAVIMAVCRPGDLVIELNRQDGGHRLATKLASIPLVDLKIEYFPFDAEAYNIDLERTIKLVKEKRPRLVIVGSSNFLFPAPLKELARELIDFPDLVLAYDASHVLGLIAGGRFQDPLSEGAHVVMGGTQKSLPGPQGGIILSNTEDLIPIISEAVYPGLISNHHLARLPALGISLLEMKYWGEVYADRVIRNARELARTLAENDIDIVGQKHGYTQSHTVLINTRKLGESNVELGRGLDESGIIVSATALPKELGGEGLRLGTNEITRLGATEDDMKDIAVLIGDILLKRRNPDDVWDNNRALANRFKHELFTFDEDNFD